MPRLTLLGLLRAGAVLVAALLVATLPRLGVPARALPDLVVILVAATAVLRGSLHGALVGLVAGWVVELVPPAGSPLGATALLYAAAGAAAGLFRREGPGGILPALAALTVASAVVEGGEICLQVLGDGVVDLAAAATRVAVTVAVGLVAMPLIVAVDHALVRRRLA